MGFFGFQFQAVYLCWVLLGFGIVFHQVIPYADIVGLVAGHVYFYFEDVYPKLRIGRGYRYLATPRWFAALLGGQ
jgi:Derlin-2/3